MGLRRAVTWNEDLEPAEMVELRYAGADSKRRAGQETFAAYADAIAYEVRDLKRHGARSRICGCAGQRASGD